MATLKTIKENPPSSYLTKLAVIESNNNPNAKAKTSSASGAYQFLESTWKGLNDKYKLGYTLNDRFDPIKAKKVADLLTKENENALRPVLGRELNDGERYLGHFLGTQGSKELLSTYLKNPNEKVGAVVSGGALKANKSIFLNKDGSQKTVGDVYNWAGKKMNIKPTYTNSVAPYLNQPQETITPNLNYFDISKETPTFVSVPDSVEEDKKETVDKDVEEVETKTKEYNFLEALQNLSREDYAHLQPEQVAQQQIVPQVDFNQQFEQVSQFIDNPVAQQGLTWQEKLANRPKKPTVAEIIAEGDARKEENTIKRDNTSVVLPHLQKKLTKEQALKVEEDLYRNPQKVEGISTGDKKVDFLYNNDWLLDIPVIGDFIKDKAKEVAIKSGGSAIIQTNDTDYVSGSYDGNLPDKERKPNRVNLLDQYFSKETLLPKSKHKPQDDYFTFLPTYSLKADFDKDKDKQKILDTFINEQLASVENEKNFKNKKNIYVNLNDGGIGAELLNADLGGHKAGIAWDKDKNLPYVSISDAWDFEPKSYSKKWSTEKLSDNQEKIEKNKERAFIQSYLMHKSGNPFKIYDRFYFDPNTKEYIPDSEIERKNLSVKQQGGEFSENELAFLSEIAIKDNNGYWDKNNQGKVVEIQGSDITMKNVDQDLIGIGVDKKGKKTEQKTMKAGKNYNFDKAIKVIEIPLFKK